MSAADANLVLEGLIGLLRDAAGEAQAFVAEAKGAVKARITAGGRIDRKLADAEVGCIVFAATAPTLAKGKGYDRELIKRMEDASGKPATTAATAFVDALTRLGAGKIAIGAPWSKTMDKSMVDFMEKSGFKVVHSEVVGFVASIELGRVGPEQAYELGLRTDRPDADAIIMPGGNWPSMSIVERLERELGKPVLANNAVSLWAGLRLLKTGDSIPGYGRLLRDHLAA